MASQALFGAVPAVAAGGAEPVWLAAKAADHTNLPGCQLNVGRPDRWFSQEPFGTPLIGANRVLASERHRPRQKRMSAENHL
jgi:hypothetical protein